MALAEYCFRQDTGKPVAEKLCDQLIGAWKFMFYAEKPAASGDTRLQNLKER